MKIFLKVRFSILAALGLFLLASGLVIPGTVSLSQSISSWTPRQRIPGIDNVAETTYLVADRDRTVHAFHSQPPEPGDPELDIVYSRWSLDSGWSLPVDILLPHSGQLAHVQGASLDNQGMLHLIYYCCDDYNPDIYYSQSPAALADRSPSWSAPVIIGADADQPHSAALAGDGQQDLFVVYSGGREGRGIYAVRSDDAGATWSEPVPIYLTFSGLLFPYAIRLHLDGRGYLHAVWTVDDDTANGIAVYHARLDIKTNVWSEPYTLATVKPGQYEVDWPSVTSTGEELLVVYNDYQPPRRIMRRSLDHGTTWWEPEEAIPPTRGEYGHADFAVDGDGVLHMVLGDRARGLTLWHTTWKNGRWEEPEPTIPVAESLAYPVGHPLEFHPSKPRIVISQGNLLLITWTLDSGHGDNGSWFSYRLLESAELPVETLSVPASGSTLAEADQPTPTVVAANPPSMVLASDKARPPLKSSSNPNQALLFSLIPVFFLAGALMLFRLLRSRPN